MSLMVRPTITWRPQWTRAATRAATPTKPRLLSPKRTEAATKLCYGIRADVRQNGGPVQLCVNPDKDLCKKSACGVDHNVAHSRFTQRYERLVPFVESRIGDGNHQGIDGPIQSPARTIPSDAVKHGCAKKAEF